VVKFQAARQARNGKKAAATATGQNQAQ